MQRKPTDSLRHIDYDCITCNPGTPQYLISSRYASVIVAGHRRSAAADEKVEIRPVVRLQHVVDVQLHVAARAV